MKLSKVSIFTPAFRSVGMGGEYGVHRILYKMFQSQPGIPRDFLYRSSVNENGVEALVLSTNGPSSVVPNVAVDSKSFMPKIEVGSRFGFSVRVNPTVKMNERRHDLIMNAKKNGNPNPDVNEIGSEWLASRATSMGVEILESFADNYQIRQMIKPKHGYINFATIDIDGIIRITDPAKFEETIRTGLGPEKSFGCGLILLRRA